MKQTTAVLTGLVIINAVLLLMVIFKATSKRNCSYREETFRTLNARIVGGMPTTIASYPFVAAIVIKGRPNDILQCGSSIVASSWVVTAAHCIILLEKSSFEYKYVYVSSGHQEWAKGNKHQAVNWVYHHIYNPVEMTNDIGLLKVKEPFTNKHEQQISIPSKQYKYVTNRKVRVLGWGVNKFYSHKVQKQIHFVEVNLIDYNYCKRLYMEKNQSFTNSMFCAGTLEGGKDACQFDSGGPIVDRLGKDKYLLIGIVSWGLGCGEKAEPGVYTKIVLYKEWITKFIIDKERVGHKRKKVSDIII